MFYLQGNKSCRFAVCPRCRNTLAPRDTRKQKGYCNHIKPPQVPQAQSRIACNLREGTQGKPIFQTPFSNAPLALSSLLFPVRYIPFPFGAFILLPANCRFFKRVAKIATYIIIAFLAIVKLFQLFSGKIFLRGGKEWKITNFGT